MSLKVTRNEQQNHEEGKDSHKLELGHSSERTERQLKYNTAVGAGAAVPRVSVLQIMLYTTPCPTHPTNF